MKNTNFVDCYQCKHFYVTWDQGAPKGCRAFGFKSQKLPSQVVWESSGEKCLKFEPKNPPHNAQKKPSDKKGWTA